MTLDGRASEIKERTIGFEVLGRPSSYDPAVDSTVRVKTGDVRRRLTLYYANSAPDDRVVIELPPGSYVPQFKPFPQEPHRKNGFFSRLSSWKLGAALLLTAAVGVAISLWSVRAVPEPTLNEFWGPALAGGRPALICVSYVPIYGVNPAVEADGRPPSVVDDFVLRADEFVSARDFLAASSVDAVMRRLGGSGSVRVGNDVTFQDLRSSPSVLIGYSYTRWGDLTADLPYLIDASGSPKGIRDRDKPTPWILPAPAHDAKAREDYAVVGRTFDRDTGRMVVLLAGIEAFGTEAAAELVSQERLLAEAMRGAPAGWGRKNLELVLHVRVISGTPGSPRVVARRFW